MSSSHWDLREDTILTFHSIRGKARLHEKVSVCSQTKQKVFDYGLPGLPVVPNTLNLVRSSNFGLTCRSKHGTHYCRSKEPSGRASPRSEQPQTFYHFTILDLDLEGHVHRKKTWGHGVVYWLQNYIWHWEISSLCTDPQLHPIVSYCHMKSKDFTIHYEPHFLPPVNFHLVFSWRD